VRIASGRGWQAAVVAALLIAASGASLLLAAEKDQEALDTLAALARRLRAEKVWTAAYRQEYIPVGMTRGDTDRGVVWLAWPDRALFATGEPARRFMGLEGRMVRLVDLEMETCEEHRLTDEEWERIPLVAVLDPAAALKRFRIILESAGHLVLVPRAPGGIARAEVVLGEGGMPAMVMVTDIQGTVNRLEFEGWAGAGAVPGGSWLPGPPPSVTCRSSDDRVDDPR